MNNIDRRVAEALAKAGEPFTDPDDRLAAQHLFSTLSALETIAVMSAERGDGVPGQLEDEYFHRKLFAELAHRNGGFRPAPAPAQKLIDYLSGMQGAMSLATLNVVAESWLESVFRHLAGVERLCPEVFRIVEEDEHRHAHGALSAARPDPEEVRPVLRDLEKMLMEISMSGEFMLPMAWFMGPAGVADMGLDIVLAHERACEHLGCDSDLGDLKVSCRAARFLDRTAPMEWPVNEWEKVKLQNWRRVAPQLCFVDVAFNATNPVLIQVDAVQALGRILAREPELRKVTRREKIYMTDHPVVGVRELYDPDRVITLFFSKPHMHTRRRMVKALAKQLKRFRDEPYEPYEGPVSVAADLERLFPPNRCSVVVSYNGTHGGIFGVGPLSDLEGIPCSVTIGSPRTAPEWDESSKQFMPKRVCTVCIQMDHRIGDGRHVGMMATEFKREIESRC